MDTDEFIHTQITKQGVQNADFSMIRDLNFKEDKMKQLIEDIEKLFCFTEVKI